MLTLTFDVMERIQDRMVEIMKVRGIFPAEADRRWVRRNRKAYIELPVTGDATIDAADLFNLENPDFCW